LWIVGQASLAPFPDFRYVGLEPTSRKRVGMVASVVGLGFGAGTMIALSGFDFRPAAIAGLLASLGSAYLLHGAGVRRSTPGGPRMGIVPWGVLVDELEAPRILRWAGIRRVDVSSSRVVVETDRERWEGEAASAVQLDRLVEHLDAYAAEQAVPIALDLDGRDEEKLLEAHEPCCEALIAGARGFLESAKATTELDLPPASYRRTSVLASSARAIDVLRGVLRDRSAKDADPRAYAAVIAAELEAVELAPELVTLTQCPHPIVAAVAKQAARKLGVARSRTGTLDEIAPFLHDGDRARLDAW
jgi:hypothetical protein